MGMGRTTFDDELLLTKDFGDSALARRFVRDVLGRYEYGGCADPVELAVSELVSNALLHGGGATRLRLSGDRWKVRVEVADNRPLLARRRREGWGLRLIDMMSLRWGVTPAAHGKVVWCEIRAGDWDERRGWPRDERLGADTAHASRR